MRGNIQRRLILFQPKRTRDPKSPNVLCLLSVKTVRNQNLFYYISTIVYKISFRRRKNVLLQIKTIQLNFLVFDSMSHSIIMIKVRQILLQYFLMAQTSLQHGVFGDKPPNKIFEAFTRSKLSPLKAEIYGSIFSVHE